MLLAQNLQEIPVNFTGISPKIMLLHGFPIVDHDFLHLMCGIPILPEYCYADIE